MSECQGYDQPTINGHVAYSDTNSLIPVHIPWPIVTQCKEHKVCNAVGELSHESLQRCIYIVMILGFAEGLARQQR